MSRMEVKFDDKQLRELIRRAEKQLGTEQTLSAIGLKLMQWGDRNFRQEGIETNWKPLRPSTVAGRRKGSSKVLQDTGRLRQSFDYQVTGSRLDYGTDSKIAPYHHHGTDPYTIRPKNARFLKFLGDDGSTRFARRVNHPGLPARPLLPSEGETADLAEQVITARLEKLSG